MPEKGAGPDNVLRLLAVSGIVCPILFAAAVGGLSLLRPGYDHVTKFMSELGETGAAKAIAMNMLGFIAPGLLMVAFAFGLQRGISVGSGIGPALVGVAGVGLVALVFFSCDPGCKNVSVTGVMHDVLATVVPFALILGILAIWKRVKEDIRWQHHGATTIHCGLRS